MGEARGRGVRKLLPKRGTGRPESSGSHGMERKAWANQEVKLPGPSDGFVEGVRSFQMSLLSN